MAKGGVAGDPFDRVLDEMRALNLRKRSDYAGDESPFQNFMDSAHQVGQAPGVSVEVLIGTKQARLRHLLFTGRDLKNESIRDSLIDRAVYSVIALAMFDAGLYTLDG